MLFALELHAKGLINVLLVPVQGEVWKDPETGDGLEFPTVGIMTSNFEKWFPDLMEDSLDLFRLLWGGGEYTEDRQ